MRWWPFSKPTAGPTRAVASPSPPRVAGMGGRLSVDTQETVFGTPRVIRPPLDAEGRWRLQELDSETLSRIAPADLLPLLSDLSPEISRALWDWLRLANPGWECTALRPGSDDPDPAAQAVLNTLLGRLTEYYGAVDVVLARLNIGAMLRGAFMAELVLDANGREAVDLATPDPATARFEQRIDPVRGQIWQLGQWQGLKGFVPLDRPTIRYIPIDPLPGSPHGRAMAAPALFAALFLIGMLHDLKRVVQQQGYPRYDIAVVMERLKEMMPLNLEGDPDALKAWIDEVIAEIEKAYAKLQPDDAFIHLDVAEMGRPVGTVDSSSLGAIDGLIEMLERMSVRALKTTPLLMGSTEGTSEANANRQWEAHLQSVKAFQHLSEQLLEYLLGIALQVQGIQARVQWRYAENRASEMHRDALTEAVQIDNAIRKYLYGWATHEESSLAITGHEPAADEPLALPSGIAAATDEATDSSGVEPGASRAQRNGHIADSLTDVMRGRP
ncbi:MAG: hypothetical protein AB7R89_06125 [Dehalococcoidia bacterium]